MDEIVFSSESPKQAEPCLQPQRDQLTARALLAGLVIAFMLCIMVHRSNMKTGITPPMSVSAGLLGFSILKAFTSLMQWRGHTVRPFTPQENTVVQTCSVAGAAIAFSAGFGSSITGMDRTSYEVLGDTQGNSSEDIVAPTPGRVFPLVFLIGLLGIFLLINVRRVLIIDFRLPWPSSTATGVLINSFHHATGAPDANAQIQSLLEWFASAFAFSCVKWMFSGRSGMSCGFSTFPTLGLGALKWSWNFDFQLIYVGAGMLCPPVVPYSMVIGALLSWSVMWPAIASRRGDWYSADLDADSYSFQGLFGYKVLVAMGLIFGDGLYSLIKILCSVGQRLHSARRLRQQLQDEPELSEAEYAEDQKYSLQLPEGQQERRIRTQYFLQERLPWWIGPAGYLVCLVAGVALIPLLYPPVRWYYVLLCYLLAPVLAIPNAFGAGLTDVNFASTYAKLAIFIFAAWAGAERQGVISGLVLCSVVLATVHSAAELMQDFRTGYLTLTSARSMFVAQLVGALMGCVLAPATFYLVYYAFPDIGQPGSEWPIRFAPIYRGIAAVGVSGVSSLPRHCLSLSAGWFCIGLALDAARDLTPARWRTWVPHPVGMAIPMYLGAFLSVDYSIGALARIIWRMKSAESEALFMPAVATGLIVGDGLWTVPAAILGFAGIQPPFCMSFNSTG